MTRVANQYGAINLAQGFPDFPMPEPMKDAACAAIHGDVNQYAITWGSPALRLAIAQKYRQWYEMEVDPDREITVCCGATEAMASVFLALVDPGDEVIVFEPYYENYGPDAILAGVVADRIGLQRVLLNLLMNAIDSLSAVADRARRLRLQTGQPQPGLVEVVVQDSGVGLEPGHLTHIFESFYTTKPEGLGMGLAISRSIVEAHNGQLSASANEGPGATFRVALPVEEATSG